MASRKARTARAARPVNLAVIEAERLPTPKARPGTEKAHNGSIRSRLGALNAANASPQAFANASANSRVGRIAAYVAAFEAAAAVDAARERANAVDAVDAAALAEAKDALAAAKDAFEGLAADATDAESAAARANVETAQNALVTLEARQAEFDAAQGALAEAEIAAETAGDPRETLEAAANKPVNDEVVAAVNSILGLETRAADADATLDAAAGTATVAHE